MVLWFSTTELVRDPVNEVLCPCQICKGGTRILAESVTWQETERIKILQTSCAWQMVTVWDNAFLTSRCTGARETGTVW